MSKKDIKQKDTPKPEDDDSTLRLAIGYRRRCDHYGIAVNPDIKATLDTAQNAQLNPTLAYPQFHFTQPLGPMQIRAFMQVAAEQRYQHLKKIRIWQGAIGDEGVRCICKLLTATPVLQVLDLLNNRITSLGCEFLGKALKIQGSKMKQLRLDNNDIKSEGVRFLGEGLRQHAALDKLSLKYCGIDEKGIRPIQEILANINSQLRSLKLQGNPIGNEGMHQLLRAVECSESLQKINVADTALLLLDWQEDRNSLTEILAEQFINLMRKSLLIIKYDIRFNPLHDGIADQMLKAVEANPKIKSLEFPNNVAYELRDGLDTILRKRNKPAKGKKGRSPKKNKSPKKGK